MRAKSSPPLKVELLGRPGCHLCDEAWDLLSAVCLKFSLLPAKVDISDDLELLVAYRDHIPVVLLNGQEIFRHRIDPEELSSILARQSSARPDRPV